MFLQFLKNAFLRLPSWRALVYRPRKDTYLFMPINGAGLGHLTRSLAIARRLQELQPHANIIFLTTSIGVTLIHRAGFTCHHIAPAALLNVGAVAWNILFYRTVQSVLSIHRPSTLVFDGTIPYLGLQRTMRTYGRIDYVWIKRGLYKKGVDSKQVNTFLENFDYVITPGELYDDVQGGVAAQGNVHTVSPISLLDKKDLLSRDAARHLLRLDRSKPCAYIQLGAGNINGIFDIQDRLIEKIQALGIQVVLGQSPISISPQSNSSANSVIIDYPNSKYFAAFDFAVLAGGYNSVCEAVMLGLPAIFIPNTATGADDQIKRAMQARNLGSYECLINIDDDQLDAAIERLLSVTPGTTPYEKNNGAVEAAKLIQQKHG